MAQNRKCKLGTLDFGRGTQKIMEKYLQPTKFLDFDNESVREYAERNSVGAESDREKAVKIYYKKVHMNT